MTICELCANDIPLSAERCPHCARPGLFPNVRAAEAESKSLDRRLADALESLETNECRETAETLKKALDDGFAVVTRSLSEALRLADSETQVLSTRALSDLTGLSIPSSSRMAKLREIAEAILFPGYGRHIRYAALALSAAGLAHYGDCALILRTEMVAHRSSVFDDDSVTAVEQMSRPVVEELSFPEGHRSTWHRRADLGLVKHASDLDSSSVWDAERFAVLILGPRDTAFDKDRLLEVHVWGPITIRAVAEIVVHAPKAHGRHLDFRIPALEDLCAAYAIPVTVTS